MTRKTERSEIESDLAMVDALLAVAPEEDVLGRMSLNSRRAALVGELTSLVDAPQVSAEAALFFGGAPVVGSRGIDATFAAQALGSYEDLVTKVWGQRQHGVLPASGPVRDRHAARLHVVGTLQGSFGFALEEIEGPLLLDGAPLRDAVEATTRVLIAAGESDDALADAAEDLDARVLDALGEFFTVLRRGGATFRVVTSESDRSFDLPAIQAAAERTQGATREEGTVTIRGQFLGVLPERRTFEFRTSDGDLIRGRVADAIQAETVQRWARTLAFQECVGRFQLIVVRSRGHTRERYTLADLAPVAPG